MTRDEVSGPAVPAPSEAPADTARTEVGEGGAVRTAVRNTGTDAADAADARGDDANDDTNAAGSTGRADSPEDPDTEQAPDRAGGAHETAQPVGAAAHSTPADASLADDAQPTITRDDAHGPAPGETPARAGDESTVADLPSGAGDATVADLPSGAGDATVADLPSGAGDATVTDLPSGAGDSTVTDLPTRDGETTVAELPSAAPAASGPPPARRRPEFEEVTSSYVVQDAPAELSPSELRVDFGAHLEANYQRLVAQLYAITLNADQAHSVVQDAYSRAWRNWSVIGRSADPTGWVRRVAVRTTMRSWRHVLARFGLARATPPVADGLDERTTALLTALRELPAPERRSVVLFHMAGLSTGEIASVEQVSPTTVSSRLDRARRVVMGDTSDLLTGVIELPGGMLGDDHGYVDQMTMPPADEPDGVTSHLDDRWERADTWNGGPDGSWMVSEAPPWDAPNSDPWPGDDVDRATGRISGDDQVTTMVPGGGSGNDLREEFDERAWDGSAGDGGVLLDEFDTVAPDGTTVTSAEGTSGAARDGASAESDEDGDGAATDRGSGRGADSDSEDRR